MNCEDISRIADTGSISTLTQAERHAAEAHALSCRRCAVVWSAHVRLAALATPPMPTEVPLRFQALIGLTAQPQRRYPLRRLTVVVGVVALAAAAGIFTWRRDSSAPLVPPPSATVVTPVIATDPEPVTAAQSGSSEVVTAEPVQQASISARPASELPLLPKPVSKPPDSQLPRLALQKLVERHPELVDGRGGPEPASDQKFFAVIAMRADGIVLSSAAQLTTPATFDEVMTRLQRTLPNEGDLVTVVFRKQDLLSYGLALRAEVVLIGRITSGGYDVARSDARVREILGHKYDELFLPSAGEEGNLLTVLLTEDGRIQRENVQRFNMYNMASVLGGGTGKGSRPADMVASQLGIDAGQIGLVGMTTLEAGSSKVVTGQNGESRIEGDKRALAVLYAWPRSEGESLPAGGQARKSNQEPEIDLAAALAIVERLIPDAFTITDYAAGVPTVVLTAKGEVIRAGRVQMRNGVTIDSLLREQLVPGAAISGSSIRGVRLTDRTGASARVTLAWVD